LIVSDNHREICFSRVQDNDDLAPLFNQYNDILKQTYGDFFVAELIESQDENNQALVAEVISSFK
jgi:hypothetical protein